MKGIFLVSVAFAFLWVPTSFAKVKKQITPLPDQPNKNTEILYCTRTQNGDVAMVEPAMLKGLIDDWLLNELSEFAKKAKQHLCESSITPSTITFSYNHAHKSGSVTSGSATWNKDEVCSKAKKEEQKK